MSFLKFNITNIPSQERVTEIGLTTDGTVEFISASDVILSTGVLSGTPTNVNSLSATVKDASVGTTTEVNFALFPVNLLGEYITIYLKTTDGDGNEKMYKLIKKGINFERNVIYDVTFDLDPSDVSVIVDTGETLQGKIAELSYTPSTITHLTISGTKELDATDFTYLKGSLVNIRVLDMSKSATKVIPEYHFYGNTILSQIYLPEGLTTIGNHAFGKSGLTSVTIPSTVTSLGAKAFLGTSKLIVVDLLRITPPQVYYNTFDATVINFYVPTAAAVTAYKDNPRWSSYKDRISSKN